jgi:itaconate CoA-transferase
VLQRPELAEDERFASNSARVAHQDALSDVITRAFAGLSASDAVARLDAAGIANARMNSMREFLDHPQLAARGRWREVESPAGALRALVPPIALDGADPVMGPVPALGQHTDAILEELGFDALTITDWRRRGIV